jgi:hypothetical protein
MKHIKYSLILIAMTFILLFFVDILSREKRTVLYFENHGLIVSDVEIEDRIEVAIDIIYSIIPNAQKVQASFFSRNLFEFSMIIPPHESMSGDEIGTLVETHFREHYHDIADDFVEDLELRLFELNQILQLANEGESSYSQSELIQLERSYIELLIDKNIVEKAYTQDITLLVFISSSETRDQVNFHFLIISLLAALVYLIIRFKELKN